jgi:hypothetical protein
MVGFIVWHIPRTQDNFVQLWMRGVPELLHGSRWAHWHTLRPLGIGVGITVAEADGVSRICRLSDTLNYANAVHQEIVSWLRGLSDSELERVPDSTGHLAAYPEYDTPGYHEETDSLRQEPIWAQLMRPCIGHVHRHLGELELAKAILRQQ